MGRNSIVAICAITLLTGGAVVSGCGGGGGDSPQASPPGTKTITASTGGTVELPGGPTLHVAAGALAADTVITIKESSAPAPNGALTKAYEFGPSGTVFSQPATVTFPLPSGTTAAAVWVKSAGASLFESVPTTISNGVASAQVGHFSVIVVGPVDFSGTWAGAGEWTARNPNGTTSAGSLMQARDVTQSVGDLSYALVNSTGSTGNCQGVLSGSTLDVSCTQANLMSGCTGTYQLSGVAMAGEPSTWANTYEFEWTGTCPTPGQVVTVSATLTRRAGPPMNIAGTYAHEETWTNTGPGVPPISGKNFGTRIRTQEVGSSAARSTLTMNGITSTCAGPIIDDKVYGTCRAPNGNTSSGTATVRVGSSPLTLDTSAQNVLSGGAYTASSSTGIETRGCISIAGTWRITQHCDAAYVGKTVVVSQSACAGSTTNPVTFEPVAPLTVSESNVSYTDCSGAVAGTTWSWHCGTCAQTLVRQ